MSARAIMLWFGLAMPPPCNEMRRDRSQDEITERQSPEPAPVLRHLPQARPQLADAHDAVDREIRRKDVARRLHRGRDGLTRPRKAGEKELRQAGGQEDEGRRLRSFEPGARRLAHEAGRENEQ